MKLKRGLVMLVNLLWVSLIGVALAAAGGWVMFKLHIGLWSREDE